MANFMGKDGFVWWQGVVEDRHDPLYLGRCRIRILGWHTEDLREMPTNSLPWAYPVQPITSAAQSGVGYSPTGPVEGTWVIGFFRDGENAQEPVFFGTLGGIPDAPTSTAEGFGDPRLSEPPASEHPFLGLSKRLLKYDLDDPTARVPRAPDIITHYGQGETVPTSNNATFNWLSDNTSITNDAAQSSSFKILLQEQGTRERYPDLVNFEGEPTTPRAARGVFGNIEGKGYFSKSDIIGQKLQWRSQLTAGTGFSVAENDDDSWNEPDPSVMYGAIYPYNHVHQSESGHIMEIDDTPGKERLHRYHRAGTFEEIGALGQRVMKVANENFNITLSNDYTAIKGNKYENIAGKLDVVTQGGWFQRSRAVDIETSGDFSINAASSKFSVNSEDIVLDASQGSVIIKGKSVTIHKDDASNSEVVKGNEIKKTGGKFVHRVGSYQVGSRGGIGLTSGLGITIVSGVGGVKESIIGTPVLDSRVIDVGFGNIALTSYIGNISLQAGKVPAVPIPAGSVEINSLTGGTTTITGGFGLSEIKLDALGIELSYMKGLASLKLSAQGISINGAKIDIAALGMLTAEATGIATLKSSAMTKVEGSIVMLN